MAPKLVNALEQSDDQTFLGEAYLALLGRPVDPSGFRDYMSRLNAGESRSQICEELMASDEGRKQAIRSREDPSLAAADDLTSSVRPVHSAADLLSLDGDEFIRRAYLSLLGREPDAAGMQAYVERLARGTTKTKIIADITADPEGQAYGAQLPGLAEVIWQVRVRSGDFEGDLSEIMDLPDASFLQAAWRMVSTREFRKVDESLFRRYLAVGMSRIYVLKQVCLAAGSSVPRVPGLAKALKRYHIANQRTWRGWYMRTIRGVESDLPTERHVRALAYRVRQLQQRATD
jgi:hypothetical protein